MAIVYAKPGESTDKIISRFKRVMGDSGIIEEFKLKERYRKPSQIRQDKKRALRQKIKEVKRQQKRKYL